MNQNICAVSLLVRDYDEAIDYYVNILQFNLIEDADMGGGKRWVMLSPRGSGEMRLLLARAGSAEQKSRIGDQTGGRVFLFLHTDNFCRDYESLKSKGVRFLEGPRIESYGTVVVFEDLYGNKWDLLEMKAP